MVRETAEGEPEKTQKSSEKPQKPLRTHRPDKVSIPPGQDQRHVPTHIRGQNQKVRLGWKRESEIKPQLPQRRLPLTYQNPPHPDTPACWRRRSWLPALRLTHFHPFRSELEYRAVSLTLAQLRESGFYWGPMGAAEAHRQLQDQPIGTFMIRDSQQPDVFFTLSYRAPSGATSVRVELHQLSFSLAGSASSFASLFSLLAFYMRPPRRTLRCGYRRERVRPLLELCRQTVIQTCGGEGNIDRLPINLVLRDFLRAFPYSI